MAGIELINSNRVIAELLAIPKQARRVIEQTAMKEANKLVAGTLKENVPVETGALKKAITHDIRKYRGGNVLVGLVGADYDYVGSVVRNKKGKKTFKKNKNATGNVRRPAKYLHLVNLGTQQRQTQAGQNRGSVTGTHFREKTTEQLAPQIEQILSDAIWKEIMPDWA